MVGSNGSRSRKCGFFPTSRILFAFDIEVLRSPYRNCVRGVYFFSIAQLSLNFIFSPLYSLVYFAFFIPPPERFYSLSLRTPGSATRDSFGFTAGNLHSLFPSDRVCFYAPLWRRTKHRHRDRFSRPPNSSVRSPSVRFKAVRTLIVGVPRKAVLQPACRLAGSRTVWILKERKGKRRHTGKKKKQTNDDFPQYHPPGAFAIDRMRG